MCKILLLEGQNYVSAPIDPKGLDLDLEKDLELLLLFLKMNPQFNQLLLLFHIVLNTLDIINAMRMKLLNKPFRLVRKRSSLPLLFHNSPPFILMMTCFFTKFIVGEMSNELLPNLFFHPYKPSQSSKSTPKKKPSPLYKFLSKSKYTSKFSFLK